MMNLEEKEIQKHYSFPFDIYFKAVLEFVATATNISFYNR